MKKLPQLTTNHILWIIYIALLLVLLPHTAWLFLQFEPAGSMGVGAAWAGAIAFESAIAVLTHKLAKRIGETPKRYSGWLRFKWQYVNAYSVGLLISVSVSALANLAHAVQFGQTLEIFAAWGLPAKLYQLAFGAVLPVVSLLFARVLSTEAENEETDPELERAKSTERELRRDVAQLRKELADAEHQRTEAEQRANAVGDLMARLFAVEKRQRILAVRERWPRLNAGAIAVIAETSPSYVSEILSEIEQEA